jgi:hypothetical protein
MRVAGLRDLPVPMPVPRDIEVLNVKAGVKKAIILLLHYNFVKVLKDALARLGSYQTLKKLCRTNLGWKKLFRFPPPYKFKKSPYQQVLYNDPIVSSKYWSL